MLRTVLLNPIFNLLLFIYAVIPGHDFGIAIIILTIIIRILLWPLVRKQLHHQKAMRDLQPEIARIKKLAKGDRGRESQLMMELFKEKEINPFGSLGLALVQFPVLIALFFVLRHIVDAEQIHKAVYGFIANLGPVKEILANPGSFHPSLLGIVDMAEPSVVLAVLAGVAQYIQAKQIMPAKIEDGPKQIGSTMVLIFPVLTVVISLQLPSALALYWLASGLIAVWQQHVVLEQESKLLQKLLRRGSK